MNENQPIKVSSLTVLLQSNELIYIVTEHMLLFSFASLPAKDLIHCVIQMFFALSGINSSKLKGRMWQIHTGRIKENMCFYTFRGD